MNQPYTTRTALALAVAALVAACGGESSAPSSAQEFASRITANPPKSDRLKALGIGGGSASAAATEITNAQFFQWAGQTFPSLFPPNPGSITLNAEGLVWDVRAYSSGNYLAVASNGRAYGLGPITGNALVDLGPVQAFSAQVCSTVNCSQTGGGGSGTLNGCTQGFSEAMRTGNTYRSVYISNVLVGVPSTTESTFEGVVNGPATFEGISAVKVTTTTSGTQAGREVNATVLSYHTATGNDLIRTLGTEAAADFQGFAATIRAVFAAPASVNDQFTLGVGGSLTKSETLTTSTVVQSLPVPIPPSTATSTSTYTFEGRESVSVQGRTWDTCRYRTTRANNPGYTLSWFIYGKGLSAKNEDYTAGGTVEYRDELKSATINGAPL